MTTLCPPALSRRAPAAGRVRLRPLQALVRTIEAWQARNELRARLRHMPDYLLRDVGLDVEAVLKETRKPFWRP
ncbi:MAG: hypothetical protein Kow00114_25080 [Kiloniellaceae bacterium]